MVGVRKKWCLLKQHPVAEKELAQAANIFPLTARILLNRGITDAQQARDFLWAALTNIHDPFLLKDMAIAVERIRQAIHKEEQILIFGDYDVDGISATTLLLLALRQLGGKVDYYLPDRLQEGYGLNIAAVEEAAATGYSLIITVDCGISALEEITAGNELGLEFIVTDHHQPPAHIPPALAIINPKQTDCTYPYQELAGVGVAFKLVQALGSVYGRGQDWWQQYFDLVALGTVADVVPLLDENRVFVKYGLKLMQAGNRTGIKALLAITGLAGKELSPGHIGFMLGPRLNAAGRLGKANRGVQLLLAIGEEEAREVAEELDRENRERQALETAIFQEAKERIAGEIDLAKERVIVLGSAGWHPGVIGIVASRLVDTYYRPTILVSFQDGEGKGSARSIAGFHIFKALRQCEDLLVQFGGHEQAAGLSVTEANVPLLRERLNHLAWEWLQDEDFCPVQKIDAEIKLDQLNLTVLEELEKLAPFGVGNPEPVLMCCGSQLTECRWVGEKKNHLKVKAWQAGCELDGIGYRMGELAREIQNYNCVDLAFTLQRNQWQGKTTLQMVLRDLRLNQTQTKVMKKLPIWQINDKRGRCDVATLAELLQGERALVFVNSAKQARTVGQMLWQKNMGQWKVAVYYAGLEKGEQAQVIRSVLTGSTDILVTTSNFHLRERIKHFRQIVWLDLNFNPQDFRRLCYLIGEEGVPVTVSLLYGAVSGERNKYLITGIVPNLELLQAIYALLQQIKTKSVNRDKLYSLLHKQESPIPPHTFKSALEILHELGYIGWKDQDIYWLAKEPVNKRFELDTSLVYQQKIKVRDTYLGFQDFLLNAPPEDIEAFLTGKDFNFLHKGGSIA
jgi:single-stranded-DNA-specific exonuclease